MAEIEPMLHEHVWDRILQETAQRVDSENPDMPRYERPGAILPMALQSFLVACYSHERIKAQEDRPWAVLTGRMGAELDAVNKHHWLPATVRELSDADLFMALHDELTQHSYDPGVYQAVKGIFTKNDMFSHISHLAPEPEGASQAE
ncbi:hypothetical protein [Halomonas nitroreducens]|uniref:Uncharacterized protein n=1 Tax=Halomonas nitroreducens TaxID=447425 RepID=A0A431V1H4_9GAMM|nr:hypothetical protein [Halomonas nitroreducens]RTR01965.1 hypothetical protein EKG36_13230 [Halomonas nitroreducens]